MPFSHRLWRPELIYTRNPVGVHERSQMTQASGALYHVRSLVQSLRKSDDCAASTPSPVRSARASGFPEGEVLMIICEIRMLFSQEVDSLYKTRLSKNI